MTTTSLCDARPLCGSSPACTAAYGQSFACRVVGWIRDLADAQRARAELNAMSDGELKDLGLTRGEIGAVADGQYRR